MTEWEEGLEKEFIEISDEFYAKENIDIVKRELKKFADEINMHTDSGISLKETIKEMLKRREIARK